MTNFLNYLIKMVHGISKKMNLLINRSMNYLIFLTSLILFLVPVLFLYLNKIQPYYFTDEKFHIPQAIRYCEGKYFEWDSKITTLPGLYIISSLILAPIGFCTTTYLRMINLICIYINFYLVYKLQENNNKQNKRSESNNFALSFITSWNVTFFPPLFFWFFLYYTDILSITSILIMWYFHKNNKNIAIIGLISILIRQTNVIWVTFFFIEKCLNIFELILKDPKSTNTIKILPNIQKIWSIMKNQTKSGGLVSFVYLNFGCLFPYLIVLLSFLCFVIWNKSIVVGDKTAHIPVVHLMQIFYYVAFTFCFAWPFMISEIKNCMNYFHKNFLKTCCFVIFLALIIHYNTLVHPYLLADNRHFTFYIWKNIFNRNIYFRYILIPLYTFSTFAILKNLSHLRLLTIINYILCSIVVIIPQLLLEPRYFIIPYLIFRLNVYKPKKWQLFIETLTTILINLLQFLIFANKTFYWHDEKYPQRIGW